MSRTGVFIAAMCEVERVKVEGEVDIFQTIKAMRKKRPHMVYNKVRPQTVIEKFTTCYYMLLHATTCYYMLHATTCYYILLLHAKPS